MALASNEGNSDPTYVSPVQTTVVGAAEITSREAVLPSSSEAERPSFARAGLADPGPAVAQSRDCRQRLSTASAIPAMSSTRLRAGSNYPRIL